MIIQARRVAAVAIGEWTPAMWPFLGASVITYALGLATVVWLDSIIVPAIRGGPSHVMFWITGTILVAGSAFFWFKIFHWLNGAKLRHYRRKLERQEQAQHARRTTKRKLGPRP